MFLLFSLFDMVLEQLDAVIVDDDESLVAIQFTPTIPHCRFELMCNRD